MKRKILPVIVFGLVLLGASAALADGDIYTGGPWGTPINTLPFTIDTPGSYYLGRNLSASGTGISIALGVSHVTLDLMGFSITGSGFGNGIQIHNSKNVEIRNGTVTGFTYGIIADGHSALAHRIINVRSVGNTYGIWLTNTGHLVKGCEVTTTTHFGIFIALIGTVTGCTVHMDNGAGVGIMTWGGIISDNVVTGTSNSGTGISVRAPGTVVKGNTVSGCALGIYAEGGQVILNNTVNIASGTGISFYDVSYNMVDQNTVLGAGTPYNPGLPWTMIRSRTNYPITYP
jgi:hypothetical protein